MASAASPIAPPISIAAFDAFLDRQRDDAGWELVGGRILAMTNPTEDHEQIAANPGAPLKLAMDAQGCRTYQGGMRIQRDEDARGTDKPRPDVMVRCGPSGGRSFVTDPLLVAEVLSPSTMDTDRGEKLAFYKSLPGLRHIVLLYQDQMRVEHYRRIDQDWDMATLTAPDDVLRFGSLGFAITLDRLYFGVEPGKLRRLRGEERRR